ncbi:hypothetical protein DEJ36_16535 [Curtobacterium sp. MCPF17_052]|nr:hypothetical protein [Curtobacterium sp. MCPF17_052]WIB14003.1 hypothetical protein DEJ36_16535 [Curtobacterium sp. MCPF17_052]
MARFGRRDTAPELALRRALHARGRRFFVDRRISSRTRARADLVFPPSSCGRLRRRLLLALVRGTRTPAQGQRRAVAREAPRQLPT